MMSDIKFNLFIEFSSIPNPNNFTRTTFDCHVNRYFTPGINYVWYKKQNEILKNMRNSSDVAWLADDDQFDSQGFYAKFVTHLVVDLKTGNILDFFVIQKNVVKSDLDKSACDYVSNNRYIF